jgi:hypothetical protein
MIHLYAFTCADTPLPAVRGLEDRPLAAIRVGDVAAVVSPLEAAGAAPTRADVIRHGDVVEALRTTTAAVLPARFGERFASVNELTEATSVRAAELREGLVRVRGCVELGVRVVADGTRDAVPSTDDGSAYMRARLAALVERDRIVEELHGRLERLACDSVVASGGGFTASYLVRNEDQPAFERAVGDFGAAQPQLTILCTGPWAPYSFAAPQAA